MLNKTIQEAITELREDISEMNERIALLEKLDISKPVDEKKWHEICETPLRSSEEMCCIAKNIFPNATDLKTGPNAVYFNLYGIKCALPTSRAYGIEVLLDWWNPLPYTNLPLYVEDDVKRKKEYFEMQDAGSKDWKKMAVLKAYPYIRPSHRTWYKAVLWFGKWRWKKIDRKSWEDKYQHAIERHRGLLELREERKAKVRAKADALFDKVIPELKAWTGNVYPKRSDTALSYDPNLLETIHMTVYGTETETK